MKTVQVAIQYPKYADSIRKLPSEDGRHRVSVIVMDGSHLDWHSAVATEPERLVVIVHKNRWTTRAEFM
jgi:hypothetical protein